MSKTRRAPAREIFGWAMFDFANSSYTTVIITVTFGVIFTTLIAPDEASGNLIWSLSLSLSYLIVVLSAPLLGAIMDFSASKKRFLLVSYLLTVVSTAALYFALPGRMAITVAVIVISNIGFASGEAFVSSFLPDLGPPEVLGKISGYAWALGYFGGLGSVLLVQQLGPLESSNMANLRFVGPVTALFFLVAGLPTFLLLRERGTAKKLPSSKNYLNVGFDRLRSTLRELKDFRDLMIFLVALFFAYAGLSIVVSFSFIYGAQVIHWDESTVAIMFVMTQLAAAGGAFGFGFLQDRIGNRISFSITLAIWIVTIALIRFAPQLTEFLSTLAGKELQVQHVFLIPGALAGLCMGATQSSGRALVGVFSPESKSGEFFGLWGLSSRLAAIVGLLGVGALQSLVGLENAILICGVFFIAAFVVALAVDERRGIEVARSHEGD
jgi:UMF1 family MFS transporter